MVPMNYNRLRGRIRELGVTQKELADATNMTESHFSQKMNNKYEFTSDEIRIMVNVLAIPQTEIGSYFFTPEV